MKPKSDKLRKNLRQSSRKIKLRENCKNREGEKEKEGRRRKIEVGGGYSYRHPSQRLGPAARVFGKPERKSSCG